MRSILFVVGFCFSCLASMAQHSYKDSILSYIDQYRDTHEVIKGDDRKKLSFFPVNEQYRVKARFEKTTSNSWFLMPTSGTLKKTYRLYGVLHFKIDGTPLQLNVYQSRIFYKAKSIKIIYFCHLLIVPRDTKATMVAATLTLHLMIYKEMRWCWILIKLTIHIVPM